MGPKGYIRSIPEWKAKGRLSPTWEFDSVGKRAELWILSREKPNEQGQWAVPPQYPEMAEAVEKVVSVLLI